MRAFLELLDQSDLAFGLVVAGMVWITLLIWIWCVFRSGALAERRWRESLRRVAAPSGRVNRHTTGAADAPDAPLPAFRAHLERGDDVPMHPPVRILQ